MAFFDSAFQGAIDVGTLGLSKYLRDQKAGERQSAEAEAEANKSKAMQGLERGFQFGEKLTGASREEIGQGQKDIRGELSKLLGGDSMEANRLVDAREQDIRAAKASGGPRGQMFGAAEDQANRQTARDAAALRNQQKQQAIAGLGAMWGDAAGDVSKLGGQMASIETTAGMPVGAAPNNLFTMLGLA